MSGSTSIPFGISRIRERAGSVFSPKKRRDTTATKASVRSTEEGTANTKKTVDSRTGDVVSPGDPDANADLVGGDVFGHGFGIGKSGQPPHGPPPV
jgi:hypothetical protein